MPQKHTGPLFLSFNDYFSLKVAVVSGWASRFDGLRPRALEFRGFEVLSLGASGLRRGASDAGWRVFGV